MSIILLDYIDNVAIILPARKGHLALKKPLISVSYGRAQNDLRSVCAIACHLKAGIFPDACGKK